jgi:hypothetical protein
VKLGLSANFLGAGAAQASAAKKTMEHFIVVDVLTLGKI